MLGHHPISGAPIASTIADAVVSLTKARVSQEALEVLRTVTAVKAQASQVIAEVLRTNTLVKNRTSQIVIEVLRQNGASAPLTSVNVGGFFAFF